MNSERPSAGMSLIVKTVTRWVKGFILLFGAYIMLYGHLTPGGGFAGGVVIACSFILLTLAYGLRASSTTLHPRVSAELDSVGALIFLAVALLGLLFGNVFFKNFITTSPASWFRLLSAGTILISNIGIGLKVGMSLFLVFAMLSALHVAVKGGKRKMMRRGRE